MNRVQRAAIVTRLARKMREKGSWCGETHLQKALYLAQELLAVPTGFDFILYKHGPFSFDLRDELTALRADRLLKVEPQQRPFGPRLATTKRSAEIESLLPKTMGALEKRLDFIADKLQGKGVADLERLATALYVIKQYDSCTTIGDRAAKLNELKPHVSLSDAQSALEQISEFEVQR
jgi:uncharacterized protein YwgA